MTELDPKAAVERLTHYAAGHPRAYETQPHGPFDKPLKADIRTLLKALAASQQQGPEIKGLDEAEAICRGRAMGQWEASLKRPDLNEAARVRGAIDACLRQAFALSLIPALAPSVGAEEPTSEPLVTLTTVRLASIRAAIRSLSLDEAQPSFAAAALVERLRGLEQKEVYNALTYLARKGELERLGYGRYLIKNLLPPFSSAAPAQAPIPEGMVLVQREPTDAMIEAGIEALREHTQLIAIDRDPLFVWRYMLAAATPAPQAEPEALPAHPGTAP